MTEITSKLRMVDLFEIVEGVSKKGNNFRLLAVRNGYRFDNGIIDQLIKAGVPVRKVGGHTAGKIELAM